MKKKSLFIAFKGMFFGCLLEKFRFYDLFRAIKIKNRKLKNKQILHR